MMLHSYFYTSKSWLIQWIGISLIAATMLSSCTHFYYVPNAQNVPLFREKKEIRAAAMYGAETESNSFQIQTAYAATKHIGVVAHYFQTKSGDYDTKEGADGYCLEAGAGYYLPIKKHLVFECYGGFAGGSQRHRYSDNFTSYLTFNRFYIQPSMGATYNGFDVALSSRVCNFKIKDIRFDSGVSEFVLEDLTALEKNNNSVLIEPALTIRGGYKYVKAQLQLIYSVNVSHPELQFDDGQVSLGLYISIAKRFKKGIEKENP